MENSDTKNQIVDALAHHEASDGLYFRNFHHLHEEDERNPVVASQEDILHALHELIQEGRIRMDQSGDEVVFHLSEAPQHYAR